MSQSKKHSALEIFFNYLTGFLLAWATYEFIVLPIDWLSKSGFLVTVLFTLISIVRSYFWRRIFNGFMVKKVCEWSVDKELGYITSCGDETNTYRRDYEFCPFCSNHLERSWRKNYES